MKRQLLSLMLLTIPAIAAAQSQVMAFDGIPNGAPLSAASALYPGFIFRVGGTIQNEALYGLGGDATPLYVSSATAFTVTSVDLKSEASTNNRIVLRGYTLDDILAWNTSHPFGERFYEFLEGHAQDNLYPASPSYIYQLAVNPSAYSTASLGWANLGALVFASRGGDPLSPLEPGWPGYGYFADNISVTVTPEPNTASFLLIGLLALATAAGRRAADGSLHR